MECAEIFRGRVVDVSKRSVTVELTGDDAKIEAFEHMVRPFGLVDPAIVSAADRERAYWQHDHLRLYGLDVADRLRGAGMEVDPVRIADSLPIGAPARYGLLTDETVFHCVRPPG